MNKNLLIVFLVSSLALTPLLLRAQTSCTQVLRDARSIYDEGRIDQLPSLLANCLKSGFTSEEKEEALKLLTLAYIFLDEPKRAEDQMLLLLRHEPELIINESLDPVEFINLYNQFDVDPVFLWGFKAGFIYNITEATGVYPIYDQANNPGVYPFSSGFQLGATAEIFINDKLSIIPELNYVYRSVRHEVDALGEATASKSTTYTTQWFSTNALAKYEVLSEWGLFAVGGVSLDLLLSANRVINGVGTNSNVSNIEMYHPFNVSGILGIGKQIKWGSFDIDVDLRYNYGIREMLIEDQLIEEVDIERQHTDNQFRLHGLSLNVSFLIPRYNPRKK